ncbi:MAG: glycosyltransferase [Candidatus Omnitrophica bacterium]|nr:glycosyltransferase [Candidatus Omnitrophota bacterium]
MKFACVELLTKSGGIWRPTPERPNYLCDQRREIDVNSFGCWASALEGEHIPLSWFVTGKKGRPARQKATLFERGVHKAKKILFKENLSYRNLEYVKQFDVVLVCHHESAHWEMLHFLKKAKAISPTTLFLATYGAYQLGRVRELWRNPRWYRSFMEFIETSDLFLIVNRAAQDYFQLVTHKPIVYFPPFYPYDYTRRFFRQREDKEKTIFVAGNTERVDILAGLLRARDFQRRHPEYLIKLTDWGKMNLEPLRRCRYEILSRIPWQKYLEETSRALFILNTDIWWTNGRVPLDAAAVGTPCIGCNANGQKECFPDLVCADIEGTAKALELAERLLNDAPFYEATQKKALSQLEGYSYENSRKRFETLVTEIREGKFSEKRGSFETVLEMSVS